MLNGWRPSLLIVASLLQLSPRCNNLSLHPLVTSKKQKDQQPIRRPEPRPKRTNPDPRSNEGAPVSFDGIVKIQCHDVDTTTHVERLANQLSSEFRRTIRERLDEARSIAKDAEDNSKDGSKTVDSRFFLLRWETRRWPLTRHQSVASRRKGHSDTNVETVLDQVPSEHQEDNSQNLLKNNRSSTSETHGNIDEKINFNKNTAQSRRGKVEQHTEYTAGVFSTSRSSNASNQKLQPEKPVQLNFPEMLEASDQLKELPERPVDPVGKEKEGEEDKDEFNIWWMVIAVLVALAALLLTLLIIWLWTKRRRTKPIANYGDIVQWQREEENMLNGETRSSTSTLQAADSEMNTSRQTTVGNENERLRQETLVRPKTSKQSTVSQLHGGSSKIASIPSKSQDIHDSPSKRTSKSSSKSSTMNGMKGGSYVYVKLTKDQSSQTAGLDENEQDMTWHSHTDINRQSFLKGVNLPQMLSTSKQLGDRGVNYDAQERDISGWTPNSDSINLERKSTTLGSERIPTQRNFNKDTKSSHVSNVHVFHENIDPNKAGVFETDGTKISREQINVLIGGPVDTVRRDPSVSRKSKEKSEVSADSALWNPHEVFQDQRIPLKTRSEKQEKSLSQLKDLRNAKKNEDWKTSSTLGRIPEKISLRSRPEMSQAEESPMAYEEDTEDAASVSDILSSSESLVPTVPLSGVHVDLNTTRDPSGQSRDKRSKSVRPKENREDKIRRSDDSRKHISGHFSKVHTVAEERNEEEFYGKQSKQKLPRKKQRN